MEPLTIVGIVVAGIIILPLIVGRFLTTVPNGVIRLVSWPWPGSGVRIYKGPCKAVEIPLLTTPASIPSQAINIDLDITDQTADRDENGIPRPIKVNVQASAIVAVGDTDDMVLTAANRFFSKSIQEQMGTLTDLLTSAGRRAINLLQHDQLFSALIASRSDETSVVPAAPSPIMRSAGSSIDEEDEDPLAIIIKRQCSRELHDLGLTFKSLNIKVVNSEVAEARRRQTAMEAKANADIVQAEQERRAQEARLAAARQISDNERDLERRRAENASQVAQAEAVKQEALAIQRAAELKATVLAEAAADADRARLQAAGQAEAERVRIVRIAEGEAERTRVLADAQSEAIHKVNEAIQSGGDAYLRIRQLEMLPQIAPEIARALAQAKIINVSGNGDAAEGATSQITNVLQTVLAAQILKEGLESGPTNGAALSPSAAVDADGTRFSLPAPAPPAKTPTGRSNSGG